MPPKHRLANELRLQQLIDIRLRDARARLVELFAEPAHDGGDVRQLTLFQQAEHARGAP